MIETETLLNYAEIAMGLMGVSGLVAVFMSRGPLAAADKLRFAIIVLGCCNMVLFAHLPIWLARHISEVSDLGSTARSLWSSSGLAAMWASKPMRVVAER